MCSLRTTASYGPWTLDAANEDTKMIYIWDFRNAIWTIIATNSAACTIKFYSSNSETRPDLDSAASATNIYSVIQNVKLEDWTPIDWNTWVVYAWASDWITTYEVNINGANWIWAIMSARTAWDVTIIVTLYDNQ